MNPPTIEPSLSASSAKNSALAIWSMILGILAIVLLILCVGILFIIPAVICGHMALSRIKRSGGALTGNGMAIAGLVTGYLSIVLAILIIPAMVLPAISKAKERGQQVVCIGELRLIDAAKQEWALDNKKQPTDVPTWMDLAPYLEKKGLKTQPVCLAGGTYQINPLNVHPTCSIPGHKLPE